MTEEFKKIESLVDKLREYVNTRLAQLKLAFAEKTAAITALITAVLLTALIFFLFLVLACTAAAIAIGNWLNNMWLGFLIMAAIVFLFTIMLWALRDRLIKKPVMNQLIKILFKEEDEEE